jgi:hypothetical protein
VPILIFLLAPVVPGLSTPAFAAFAAAVVFSIGVQAVGAFFYPNGRSDRCILGPSRIPIYGGNAWDVLCTPYIMETRNGPARPILLPDFVNFFRHHLEK